MNIVLTGFMATGKTQISKCISNMLSMPVIDTDAEIEKAEGISISEIFEKFGEEYFRKKETEIILKISYIDKSIISTGGGSVLNPQNIEALRKNGIIFNLDADFETISERVKSAAKTRPLMNGQSIENIKKRFNSRKKFYDNCDYKIKISNQKSPIDHANDIINILKKEKLIDIG